jgi:hypothetical protein
VAAEDAGRLQDVAFRASMRLAVPGRTLVTLPVTGSDVYIPERSSVSGAIKEGPPAVLGGPFGVGEDLSGVALTGLCIHFLFGRRSIVLKQQLCSVIKSDPRPTVYSIAWRVAVTWIAVAKALGGCEGFLYAPCQLTYDR